MPPMADYETLIVNNDNGILWVSLNRPEVRNAISAQMQADLRAVWTGARWDDDVRCIVLTAEGDHFCTGIDRAEAISESNIAAIAAGKNPGFSTPWVYDDPGRDISPKNCDLWKPVISAVQGQACAGAFYMLGDTEFIIASEEATFFDPHVTYGMTAAYEPIHLLSKMPFPEIMRMALLGVHERMSAQRAHEIGLVSEVVPRDELRERAEWCARRIADAPALAIQGTLRCLWNGRDTSRAQAIEQATYFISIGTDAAAFEEGQAAFKGKRPESRTR